MSLFGRRAEHASTQRKNFQLNGYHFWKGTAQFPDHGPNGWPGGPTLPELVKANHAYAKELGARLFFETEALQLVMDGDAVPASWPGRARMGAASNSWRARA